MRYLILYGAHDGQELAFQYKFGARSDETALRFVRKFVETAPRPIAWILVRQDGVIVAGNVTHQRWRTAWTSHVIDESPSG